MANVLFYHWDWKEQPEIDVLQRAIDAVFDGAHAPRVVTDFPGSDNWDQNTVAICSKLFLPKELGDLFQQHLGLESDDMFWWRKAKPPTPFKVSTQ